VSETPKLEPRQHLASGLPLTVGRVLIALQQALALGQISADTEIFVGGTSPLWAVELQSKEKGPELHLWADKD